MRIKEGVRFLVRETYNFMDVPHSSQDISQPSNKIIAVFVIPENLFPLNAPTNDVVQGAWRVYSCFSRHNYHFTYHIN
jgi:hypothetical protein